MFAQTRRERWKMILSMCYTYSVSNLHPYDPNSTSKKKRKKTTTKVNLSFFSVCGYSHPTGYSPPPIPRPFKERCHGRRQRFRGNEIWYPSHTLNCVGCIKFSPVVMSDPKSRTGDEDKKTISKMSIFVYFDNSNNLTFT
jgi:hypothetical protein